MLVGRIMDTRLLDNNVRQIMTLLILKPVGTIIDNINTVLMLSMVHFINLKNIKTKLLRFSPSKGVL